MHEDGVEPTIALLRRVVDAGAVAVTLHGRNWTQRGQNRGKTDYEGFFFFFLFGFSFSLTPSKAMRAVREGLPPSVAFVANGDIQEYEDFERIMNLTGARAGMSGYGALLDPGGEKERPFVFVAVVDFFRQPCSGREETGRRWNKRFR